MPIALISSFYNIIRLIRMFVLFLHCKSNGWNVEITEKGRELIEAINFRRSKHNPSQQLEKWAIVIVENMMYDDDEEED